MPFNLETFINDFLNSTGVNSVINNPIWTAIIITVIILLIMYFQFADSLTDDISFWPLWIQTGIWILITTMGMLFLHFKNIDNEYNKKGDSKQAQQIVQGATENVPELTMIGSNEPVMVTVQTPQPISGAFKNSAGVQTVITEPIAVRVPIVHEAVQVQKQ